MAFIPFETMHSHGLLVRQLNSDDCRALFEQILGDEETMRDLVLVRHADAWATEEYITDSMSAWRSGTRYRYGLFGPEGELTAVVELTPRLPQVELGVVISKRGGSRKRRDSIGALRAIIDTVIMLPGVYRICAYCAIDGRAFSSMERLGFKREGTLINYEARPNRGLAAADSYLYALTWPIHKSKGAPETNLVRPEYIIKTGGHLRFESAHASCKQVTK